eukprot:m.221532 g.221532  ORF g.221532 m.221532 type:complete len:850 (-) comp22291_c0_seq1:22-2571(-)
MDEDPELQEGEDDAASPKLSEDAGASSSDNGIRVAVRLRPLNAAEEERRDSCAVRCTDDGQTLAVGKPGDPDPKTFTFHCTLAPGATQEDCFERCGVKPLISNAIDGYSCTVFAFGQTGSGKTHTITGPDNCTEADWGLIQRSIRFLFEDAERRRDSTFTFQATYIEVYNEQVLDLLNPNSGRGALPVRWKADRGFYVENVFVVECACEDDALAVLEEGMRYRQVAGHEMNERSSRSHAMLTIYINSDTTNVTNIEGSEDIGILHRHGTLTFVDLAGSERVKISKSEGQMMVESNNINKSLLTLGNCISALADTRKRAGHVPFRESTLTMLLKDSLGGTGLALMIACVSPSGRSITETLNTLRYASRAKRIQNKPIVHLDPQQQLIVALRGEVRSLKAELAYYKAHASALLPELAPPPLHTAADASPPKSRWRALKDRAAPKAKGRLANSVSVDIMPIAKEITELRVMLQQYMQENEDLRSENVFLYGQQQLLKRTHEDVVRDNERLLRQMNELECAKPKAPAGRGRGIAAKGGGGGGYAARRQQQLKPAKTGAQPEAPAAKNSLTRFGALAPKAFDKSFSTLNREIESGEYLQAFDDGAPRFDGSQSSWSSYDQMHSSYDPQSPPLGLLEPIGSSTSGFSRDRLSQVSSHSSVGGLGAAPPQPAPAAAPTRNTRVEKPSTKRPGAGEAKPSKPVKPAKSSAPVSGSGAVGAPPARGKKARPHHVTPLSPSPGKLTPLPALAEGARASPGARVGMSTSGSSTSGLTFGSSGVPSTVRSQLRSDVDQLDAAIAQLERQLTSSPPPSATGSATAGAKSRGAKGSTKHSTNSNSNNSSSKVKAKPGVNNRKR